MSNKAQKLIKKLPSSYFTRGDKEVLKELGDHGDYLTGKGIWVARGTISKDSCYSVRSVKRALRKARKSKILKQSLPHDMKNTHCKSAVYEWDFNILQGIVDGTIELPVEMLLKKRVYRKKSRDIGSTKSGDIGSTINKLYMDYKITFDIPKSVLLSKTVDNSESLLEPSPTQIVMNAHTEPLKQDGEPFNKIVDNLSQGEKEEGCDPEKIAMMRSFLETPLKGKKRAFYPKSVPLEEAKASFMAKCVEAGIVNTSPVWRSKTIPDRIAA